MTTGERLLVPLGLHLRSRLIALSGICVPSLLLFVASVTTLNSTRDGGADEPLYFVVFPVAILLLCQELNRYQRRGRAFLAVLLRVVMLSLVMVGLRNYGTFGDVIRKLPSISLPMGCCVCWLGWRDRKRVAA